MAFWMTYSVHAIQAVYFVLAKSSHIPPVPRSSAAHTHTHTGDEAGRGCTEWTPRDGMTTRKRISIAGGSMGDRHSVPEAA
jgi:hypothetical protein